MMMTPIFVWLKGYERDETNELGWRAGNENAQLLETKQCGCAKTHFSQNLISYIPVKKRGFSKMQGFKRYTLVPVHNAVRLATNTVANAVG